MTDDLDLKSTERPEQHVETRNQRHHGFLTTRYGYDGAARRICTLCYKQPSMYTDAAAQMSPTCVPLEYTVDLPSTQAHAMQRSPLPKLQYQCWQEFYVSMIYLDIKSPQPLQAL